MFLHFAQKLNDHVSIIIINAVPDERLMAVAKLKCDGKTFFLFY
jgi:hypothetical protein